MIKQTMALCWITLKCFHLRLASSIVSILSIACVAAVMLSVLALTDGMFKTMQRSGLEQTLLVMRMGAVSELQSVLFPMEVNLMANHQFISRDANNIPIQSAEMFVNGEYIKHSNNNKISTESLAIRGVSSNVYYFKPNFKIVAGDKFKSGLREIIIGQAIARRMPELTVGSTIKLGTADWKISGIFSDENSVFESEVWADLSVIQNEYRRGNSIQSVRLAIQPDSDYSILQQQWDKDPRLNVKVIMEKQHFANQAENLTRLIRWVGIPVAVMMAIGAMIAALNTMYAAISNRSQEIATHKAIGFMPFPISIAIIFEALILASIGGFIGILPLYFLYDGWVATTNNVNDLSQMMFNFDITISLMSQAMLLSLLIGLVGGLLPARKAIRIPVSLALKST